MQLRTVISGHRLLKKPHVATLRMHTQKMNFFFTKLNFGLNNSNYWLFNRNPIFLSQSSPIWLENYTELIFFFEWKLLIWLANYIFCNNIAKVTPHVPCTFRPFFLIVKGVILMNSRVLNCQKIMTSAYRIISSIFSVILIFFWQNLFFMNEMKYDNFKIVCTL